MRTLGAPPPCMHHAPSEAPFIYFNARGLFFFRGKISACVPGSRAVPGRSKRPRPRTRSRNVPNRSSLPFTPAQLPSRDEYNYHHPTWSVGRWLIGAFRGWRGRSVDGRSADTTERERQTALAGTHTHPPRGGSGTRRARPRGRRKMSILMGTGPWPQLPCASLRVRGPQAIQHGRRKQGAKVV